LGKPRGRAWDVMELREKVFTKADKNPRKGGNGNLPTSFWGSFTTHPSRDFNRNHKGGGSLRGTLKNKSRPIALWGIQEGRGKTQEYGGQRPKLETKEDRSGRGMGKWACNH